MSETTKLPFKPETRGRKKSGVITMPIYRRVPWQHFDKLQALITKYLDDEKTRELMDRYVGPV